MQSEDKTSARHKMDTAVKEKLITINHLSQQNSQYHSAIVSL